MSFEHRTRRLILRGWRDGDAAAFEAALNTPAVTRFLGGLQTRDSYLHLAGVPRVLVGDTVVAGQRLGDVGATGRASACHLHFEQWDGTPYLGARLIDPTPALLAWDQQTGAGLATRPTGVRRPSRAR